MPSQSYPENRCYACFLILVRRRYAKKRPFSKVAYQNIGCPKGILFGQAITDSTKLGKT